MINVNDFPGLSDNDAIERAIDSRGADGVVVIPPRASQDRDWWLLDRAVLLPENTTVILRNCTVKLSDRCRDNFFRTANCGLGIENPPRVRNIHLVGEGDSRLVGADHPRATGDSSKRLACPCPYLPEDICRLADWVPPERRSPDKLDFWDAHDHSYGTDAGKPGESQYGDWRGIGVLFANVENFSIENLTIVKSHGWGVSLEACENGRVEKLRFDANMSKEIGGLLNNMENQDGVDVRNGCHDIVISDIAGHTGDDVVALTAIAGKGGLPGGSLRSTHVMGSDWTRRDPDIHDVIIRNVTAYSQLCYTIRLLACDCHIWNVVIDGVVDSPPEGVNHAGVLLVGEGDTAYGKNLPDGIRAVTVSNVIASTPAITVAGYLMDAAISNVVSRAPGAKILTVIRENGIQNTQMTGCVCAGEM